MTRQDSPEDIEVILARPLPEVAAHVRAVLDRHDNSRWPPDADELALLGTKVYL